MFNMGFSTIFVAVPFVMICIGSVIMLGLMYWAIMNSKKSEDAWKAFAQKYRLTYSQPDVFHSGVISGEMEGRQVTLKLYTTGSGRNRAIWTMASIPVQNPKGWQLSVGAKGVGGMIAKAFGGQDIEIGVEEFDRVFTVRANPPELAARILVNHPDLRAGIEQISPYELQLNGKTAICRVIGRLKDEIPMLNLIRLTKKLVEVVERLN